LHTPFPDTFNFQNAKSKIAARNSRLFDAIRPGSVAAQQANVYNASLVQNVSDNHKNYVVVVNNLMAGTNVADISRAMLRHMNIVAEGCSIVRKLPSVIAEVTLDNERDALQLVEQWNKVWVCSESKGCV
jgi:hypothetical protein